MAERLPAHVEAAAIIRRVHAEGGFAAVLSKGDPDRGALVLIVRSRDALHGVLERRLSGSFEYRWSLSHSADTLSPDKLQELVASRRRFDPDSWLIELDIAEPERFIAETTSSG